MDNASKLVVVGQGYVGLPLAMRAVAVGMDVVGYDLDKRKIDGLANAQSHVGDISDAELSNALSTGRYVPTVSEDDLDGFDIAVITVPTPLTDGAPDISYIEGSASVLGRHLSRGALVVLESTTYPGTTEEVVAPILERESGLTIGTDFRLGYSPERIDPGNEVWTFERTPKVVSGVDDASLAEVTAFYERLVDTVVPTSGTREAELAKLLENTFRHVNIALINELAIHAHGLGVDIWDVIDAAASKPFGFMSFQPGPGVGGHCLPVDPSYLSWKFERQLGSVSRFVKIANSINEGMPAYVVHRVQLGLNRMRKPVNGAHILVLGFAYKRDSNDARETPALPLVRGLLDLGADVKVHDTYIADIDLDNDIELVELTAEQVAAADAVVLVTDHDNVDYQLVLDNATYIFDTRHRLSGEHVESL